MKVKVIFFDLDGTLLNTLTDLSSSIEKALLSHGLPANSIEQYRFFIGNGMRKAIERACPKGTPSNIIDSIFAEAHAHYSKNWAVQTTPYQGIPELLQELSFQDITLMVLTNKPDHFAKEMISYYFSQKFFSVVQGQVPNLPIKPAPDVPLALLKKFNISSKEALFIGDSDVDMQTGKNADIVSVGVSWGFRPVEELKKNGAVHIVKKPEQILNLL